MEALELSERTVPGKGGKAGPQGRKLVEYHIYLTLPKILQFLRVSSYWKADEISDLSNHRFLILLDT